MRLETDAIPSPGGTDAAMAVAPKPSINLAHLPLDEQLEQFKSILRQNETLIKVLEGAAQLNLPNWYLAAGAVTQTVWNHVTGQHPETGIHDYDLIYHDPTDLSYEAEDLAIQRGAAVFSALLHQSSAAVEIRNQARVHLWYESKFGVPCPAYGFTEQAIDAWTSNTAMIGVRVRGDGGDPSAWEWRVYAPVGLSDMFKLVVRPNPVVATRTAYEKKLARWKGIWPSLEIHPWPEGVVAKAQDVTLSVEAR